MDMVMMKNMYRLINVNVVEVAVPVSRANRLKRNQSDRKSATIPAGPMCRRAYRYLVGGRDRENVMSH